MKKLTSILSWAGLVVVAIALSSCGSMKNNFTRAKYYNFGHNDPVITLNKPAENATVEKAPKATTKAESAVTNKVAENKVTNGIANSAKEKAANEALVQKKIQNKRSIAGSSVFKRIVKNTERNLKAIVPVSPDEIKNTDTGGRGGTVPLIILVILAIAIPPLAVLLHDNFILKLHFWLILLLWAIGLYGIFGIYGLLIGWGWLIATIWALIIVLTSAGSV